MCAPSEFQCGALREGGGTREAGSIVAESLVVVLYRVGSIVDELGGAEPLCARIKGVNREVSEGKAESDV